SPVRGRRRGAPPAGCARRSRVGGERLALRRLALAAELHAAAELSRNGRAGSIVERRSREDCGLARGGSRAVDARAAARPVGQTSRRTDAIDAQTHRGIEGTGYGPTESD